MCDLGEYKRSFASKDLLVGWRLFLKGPNKTLRSLYKQKKKIYCPGMSFQAVGRTGRLLDKPNVPPNIGLDLTGFYAFASRKDARWFQKNKLIYHPEWKRKLVIRKVFLYGNIALHRDGARGQHMLISYVRG